MRSFVNDIAPDPLAYAGQKREPILVSVGQSICWVVSRSWSELPELTEDTLCGPDLPGIGSRVALDDFVDHHPQPGQPGDARRAAAADQPADRRRPAPASGWPTISSDRDIQVFMLSNQLPLLEAGREGQQVTGQVGAYCGPSADQARAVLRQDRDHRLLRPERPDELPGARPVRRQVHRVAPVPERHQRHDQRGVGELPPGAGRCRQPALGATRATAPTSGSAP